MWKQRLAKFWWDFQFSFEPESIVKGCHPVSALTPAAVIVIFVMACAIFPDVNSTIHLSNFVLPIVLIFSGGVLSILSWRNGSKKIVGLAVLQLFENIMYTSTFMAMMVFCTAPASHAFAGLTVLIFLYYSFHFSFSILGTISLSVLPITLIVLGYVDTISAMILITGLVISTTSSQFTRNRRKGENKDARTEEVLSKFETLLNASTSQKNQVAHSHAMAMAHEIKNDLLPFYMNLEAAEEMTTIKDVHDIVSQARVDVQKMISSLETSLKNLKTSQHLDTFFPIDELIDELATKYPDNKLFLHEMPNVIIAGELDLAVLAIQNIIENAFEANASKVTISGISKDDEKSFEISIQDNGTGLPATVLDKMFKPFNTTGKPNGVGLGIYLSNQLIQSSGGSMRLSKTSNAGTTFKINLFCAPANGQRPIYRFGSVL